MRLGDTTVSTTQCAHDTVEVHVLAVQRVSSTGVVANGRLNGECLPIGDVSLLVRRLLIHLVDASVSTSPKQRPAALRGRVWRRLPARRSWRRTEHRTCRSCSHIHELPRQARSSKVHGSRTFSCCKVRRVVRFSRLLRACQSCSLGRRSPRCCVPNLFFCPRKLRLRRLHDILRTSRGSSDAIENGSSPPARCFLLLCVRHPCRRHHHGTSTTAPSG